MSKYELIAFDMDGTLLNSEKRIEEESIQMIKEAHRAGKRVILSTGRSIPELKKYLELLPEIQFLVGMSGALVYDVTKQKAITSHRIEASAVQQILKQTQDLDLMIHLLSMESIVQKNKIERMHDYHMGIYQSMFEEITTKPEDIFAYYEENAIPLYKVNMYLRNRNERRILRERLQHMALSLIDAEEASLECTAQNISKGYGLLQLCRYLHIPVEHTIAVGDADNDLEILNCAGLAVAMGNANERVKEAADVVVGDNDHNGCAEVIRNYLLDK